MDIVLWFNITLLRRFVTDWRTRAQVSRPIRRKHWTIDASELEWTGLART